MARRLAPVSVVALVVLLLPLPTIAQQPAAGGAAARNRAAMDRFVEIANARDYGHLVDVVADDFVRHSPSTPDVVVRSRDDFLAYLRADNEIVPDSRIECPITVAEAEYVASWCTYSGTEVAMSGGRPLELSFAGVSRFEDGRIAEMWVVWDNMDALMQLGLFPPEGLELGVEMGEPADAPRADRTAGAVALIEAMTELWNDHDPSGTAALFAADAVYEDVAMGMRHEGPEAIRAFLAGTFEWAPDFHVEVTSLAGADGRVVAEWIMTGTPTVDESGMPASGRSFSIRGVTVAETRNGRITRVSDYWDRAAMMEQLRP